VRYNRRIQREAQDSIWNDEDVLDLTYLFNEKKKYEPEDWNYADVIDISTLFGKEN